MKFLKKFFYGLVVLIMLICAGILVLAFSPDMTKTLSETLYGEKGILAGVGKESPQGEESGADAVMTDPQDNSYRVADGVLASDSTAGYVAPIRSALELPQEVSNKSGLKPPQGSSS